MPKVAMNYQLYQPLETFNFPESVYGKQKHSFQHHWFEKYPWLNYDVEEVSVIYIFCKRQNTNSLSERCKEETFLKTGYKNWKMPLKRLARISSRIKQHREISRCIFPTIPETLQYLARQGLGVRSDDDNESNFIQLLRLQSKTFLELIDWLSKQTKRCTGHDIQNKIINLT